MKKLLTILLLLIYGICNGQVNLVPNPSFEIIDSCNFGINCGAGISRGFVPPWDDPIYSSSDLYNACCTRPYCIVPSNIEGYQNAHSGNGYAGIICLVTTSNYREYIQAPLDSALIAGHKYIYLLPRHTVIGG